MVPRQHPWLRSVATSVLIVALVFLSAGSAFAQEENRSSPFADIVKGVFFDPTTYAPAIISYDATMRDWKTSQPFFQNGYVEHNARFTVSGRPNDTAIGYQAGKRLILKDTLSNLGVSVVQNTTSRLVERALLARYPERRTMVKTIGWVQRIAVGSLMTYHLSAAHYRQANFNAQRAQQLGFAPFRP